MREVFVLHRSVYAIFALATMFACSAGHAQPRIKPAQPGVWPVFPSGHARAVRVSDNYAYLGLGRDSLAVIDMSDPGHPVRTDAWLISGGVRKVPVVSNLAYVVVDGRLEIVNVSDPTHLAVAGTYKPPLEHSVNDLNIVGRYAFVAGGSGLDILDLVDPARPVLAASVPIDIWRAIAIKVMGRYAHVLVSDTLVLFDIIDPIHPVRLGQTWVAGFLQDLDVVGQYAYLSADDDGLQICDLSDPNNPVRAGGYGAAGSAGHVEVVGDYAYLADGRAGLEIVDVTVPGHPLLIGNYNTGAWLTGFQLAGTNAVVSDWALSIVDISNPASPQLIGHTTNIDGINDLQVAGSHAFVAGYGLQIIDLSSPTNPVVV